MKFLIIAIALGTSSCVLTCERFESQVKEASTGEYEIFVSLHLGQEEPVEFAEIKGEWARLAVEHCGRDVYIVSNYREKAIEIVDGNGEIALSVYGIVSCRSLDLGKGSG